MANTAWGFSDATDKYNWGSQDVSTPLFDSGYTGANIDTSSWNLDWGINQNIPSYSEYGKDKSFNWNNAFGAIGKALDMAKAWKGQSTGTSTGSGTVSIPTDKESTTTQISPSIRVVRGPMRVKQTTTGGSSGGGIGSTLLGIGSTVASMIPGGQPVGAALGVASKGASMFGV